MRSVTGSGFPFSSFAALCAVFLLIGLASQALGQTASEPPIVPPCSETEAGLESLFYETLQAGNGTQAEEVLYKLLAEPGSKEGCNLPQMFLSLGNHYSELSVPEKAKFWLEKLIAEYGTRFADEETKVSYKDLISGKLTWLKNGGKRPWAQPDPTILAKKLNDAVRSGDLKTLDSLLAQIDTYVGCQSNLEMSSLLAR